jgi:hypothetical protein
MTETQSSSTLEGERPAGAANESLEEKRRRNAVLIQKVEEKRLDEENEDLERELADTTGVFHAAIKGVAYQTPRKRAASPSDEPYRQQRARTSHASRANPPPEYHAKNLRELSDCEAAWQVWFEDENKMEEFPTERARITYIATFLRGKALTTWSMTPDRDSIAKWEEFIEVLRGALQNLDNRKVSASATLKTVQQKEGQNVQDLLTYIERLEKDLPYEQNEVAKGHVLYDALLPRLQLQVLKEIKKIESRDQVLAAAHRHEELLASEKRIDAARMPRAPSRPAYLRTQANTPRTQSAPSIDRAPKKDYKKDPCYNCGEHGHIAKFCTTVKKEAKK